ncbi:MAG: hypothetical protein U0325_00325 [Polyangiales bacterium]
MRAAAALVFAAVTLVGASAGAQCTTRSSCPPCTMCRVAPASGSNPTVGEMSTLFDRVAAGPQAYGALGWDFGGRNTIGAGSGWCTGSGRRDTVAVSFPCVLLKAIYLTESSWRQFCTDQQTVISFDCGYGIAQVTSGMRRGETSAYDANRVASSAAYNVSVGAAILADKWRASPCVGGNDPDVIEHWYFATWGYNGFAFSNNPNNPMYAADRREFRTPGVASAQVRGNYPYQELVWGYAHYPLTTSHYTGIALAYPARGGICASCGRPTASLPSIAGEHRSECPHPTMVRDAGPPVVDVPVVRDVPAPQDVVDVIAPPDVGDVPPPRDVSAARDVADVVAPRDVPGDLGRADAGGPAEGQGGCGCAVPTARRPATAGIVGLSWALAQGLSRRRRRKENV